MSFARALTPGMRLGSYQLKQRLAIGGMAEVWLAESSGTSGFHKTVVLKTILPQFVGDPLFVRMFTDEALLASMLSHHNIVQIYDLRETEGIHFIAMEYVRGLSLRQVQHRFAREGRTPPPWFTVHVCMAVCDALEYAHAMCNENGEPLRLVHRDVTPENIMVSFSGVTKVLDFGIAKVQSAPQRTQAGMIKGKLAYMAPERIHASKTSADADNRSDLYSVGVMLYELFSGHLPLEGPNELALLKRIMEHPPTPLRQLVPDVPRPLEEIVLKALAKDPSRRHSSASELREELAAFLEAHHAVTTTERHVAALMSWAFPSEASQRVPGSKPTGEVPSGNSKLIASLELNGFNPVQGPEATPIPSKASAPAAAAAAVAAAPPPPPGRPEPTRPATTTPTKTDELGARPPEREPKAASAQPAPPAAAKPPPKATAKTEPAPPEQPRKPIPSATDLAAAAKAALEAEPQVVAASQEETTPTVLMVDADGVSRRFVEMALTKDNRFIFESSKSAMGALDILQTSLIDLIICESDLPDMDGLQLHRRLSKERRLASTPFLMLSSDTRAARRVVAIDAGVDDYITKPCDAGELVARAEAHVRRRRAMREQMRRRSYVLAGDFTALPVPDLVGMLEMGARSGTLSIAGTSEVGEIVFQRGKIAQVRFGNLVGAEAFYRLMEEARGQFEFSLEVRAQLQQVEMLSATHLILEGARRLDTKRRDELTIERPTRGARAKPTLGPEAEAAPALTAASPALAPQFEMGIRDGFSLGALRLWTEDDMAGWTLGPGGRDRVHAHLLADLATGVSAMMALASPPTEHEITAGLAPERKIVALEFFLRHERLLDVVLVDVRQAGSFLQCLQRRPQFIIFAPPDGDLFALGTEARVQIELYLQRSRPQAVLAVGNSALGDALGEVPYMRAYAATRTVEGILGEGGGADLRELLVEGLRLWASGAQAAQAESG